MKKKKQILSLVLSGVFTLSVFLQSCAFSPSSEISVLLDGEKVAFDVEPQIIDGRTMVPLRKIFEEIGAAVKWNGDTRTVSARKGSKTVTLEINSSEMQIEKGGLGSGENSETGLEAGNAASEKAETETVQLDVPAQIVSGRTLVPTRAVSEAFGLSVDWNEKNQTVSITSQENDNSWKENTGTINLSNLSCTGSGVEVSGSQISITEGGDFTVEGTLNGGNIVVNTEDRVKLRLNGAAITAEDEPCIYIENADKAFITVSEGSKNYLTAKNCEKGAVYSKDNLEIKGGGELYIESGAGHGIKAADSLTVENGTICINAKNDAIHVNETFKITGGTVKTASGGDGIDSESIVMISGGTLDIETTAVPVQSGSSAQNENSTQNEKSAQSGFRAPGGSNTDAEFESSSKGIKADWLLSISGGDITVNSADHAIHSADEIEITGGNLNISSQYGKGVSAHGNLTVSGSATNIDITKSTEGLESKNILTVNDGTIKINATDDGINATGGNSGDMQGGAPGNPPQMGEAPNGDMGTPPQMGEAPNGDMGTPPQMGEAPNGEMGTPPQMGEAPNGDMGTPPQMGEAPNGEMGNPPQMGEMPNGEQGGKRRFFGKNNEQTAQDGQSQTDGEKQLPFGGGRKQQSQDSQNGTDSDGSSMQNMPGRDKFGEGGRGGNMPEESGKNGRNYKDCLVINGGDIEIYAEDDCLDSNGNLILNGGTIKAVKTDGSFSGPFGVFDPDGELTVNEGATVIAASLKGEERKISTPQNTITVYCTERHTKGDKISLQSSSGSTLLEYSAGGDFKAVFITSPLIKSGETYTVAVGGEKFEAAMSEQNVTLGSRENTSSQSGRFSK